MDAPRPPLRHDGRALRGILPPVPTPFGTDGDLDERALGRLIDALEPEVDGVLALGSNGEAAYLDEAERDRVVAAARAALRSDTPLLVGTGGEATRLVIERCRRAADLGADAVLVLAPHYFRGQMSEGALERHFSHVAEASPAPMMLYNIPQATGLALSPALCARLAEHPNIVGIKDSSGDVNALTELMRLAPAGFTVMTGHAPTLLPALSLGAAGGILAVANVAPNGYRAIWRHAGAGALAEARALQLRLNPLALAVTARYGVPGLKAALALRGRSVGGPRPPLLPASEETRSVLAEMLERLEPDL